MIENFTFGKIVIDGENYEDIKIIGDRVLPWHYIIHHTVTQQDIVEIFGDDPEYVVIGIGTSRDVHVDKDVIELAKERNINLVIEDSEKACQKYNKLKQEGKKVNAIIHSTC
ncbi:hypothetical protein CEE44_01120 [Candidatus Woesearchaeota archaeon B3_Woes]|nr:MAG: hypothetical protein CEE44_01120 [Candidatus Woesearchaeota archaeon B3_Woes]